MDATGARTIWRELNIAPDFDNVYNGNAIFDRWNGMTLFNAFWASSEAKARERSSELNLDYDSFPEWKQFILADIVYNTGSVKHWKKVFIAEEPSEVLFQARRKQVEIDGRVAKIGHYFGLIKDLDEAHEIGLVGAKYLV